MVNLAEVERAIINIFKGKGKSPGEVIRFMEILDLGYSPELVNEAKESLIAKGCMEEQGGFLKLTQSGSPL
jgi:hypothetical protein